MDRDPGKNKDPTVSKGGGGRKAKEKGAGDDGNERQPPIPAVRSKRAQKDAKQQQQPKEQEHHMENVQESSLTRRSFMKTMELVETSSSTSSSSQFILEETLPESPHTPQRLKQKVAMYEKLWSSGVAGGSAKRASEQSPDDLRIQSLEAEEGQNMFDIDVQEIEKRLRLERQRGLAEAETAKLAFQQIQLRSTPTSSARKVEVHEQQTASPFNVTLKTVSHISPGAELSRLPIMETPPSSPFNVTLRTTRRSMTPEKSPQEAALSSAPFNVTLRTRVRKQSHQDPKQASAQFLESEKTVREVQTEDGIRTIITSSRTTDGRKHEEKIFRHGEGYVSPRESPQREFVRNRVVRSEERAVRTANSPQYGGSDAGRYSVSPAPSSHSIDMTAGGQRILIKLQQEGMDTSDFYELPSKDETDFKKQTADTMANQTAVARDNIDILVGSNHMRRPHYYYEKQQYEQKPEITHKVVLETKQQRPQQLSWQTNNNNNSNTKTTLVTSSTPTTTSSSQPPEIVQTATTSSTQKLVTTKITTKSTSVTKNKIIESPNFGLKSPIASYNPVAHELSGSKVRLGPRFGEFNEDDSFVSGVESAESDTSLVYASPVQQSASSNSGISVSSIITTTSHCGTLPKSLYGSQTQQQQQSTTSNNDIQEYQTAMASINYARSNSQYDSHIREKKGKITFLYYKSVFPLSNIFL